MSGHAFIVELLLNGTTDVMFSFQEGYNSVVQCLASANANMTMANDRGLTAVMYASQHGRVEYLIALIAPGATLDNFDMEGRFMHFDLE